MVVKVEVVVVVVDILDCAALLVSMCGFLFHIGLTIKNFLFLGHHLGDDLIDWNSGLSTCMSVHPSAESFSDFDLI